MRDDERFTPADQLPPGLYERAKALVDAVTVVEGCTVPWLAGRSSDGKEFYPDIALPAEVTDAKIRTRRSVAIHEMAELIRMNEGVTYDDGSDPPGTAHYDANGCEKIEVEAQGATWEPYCLALRPLIKECDDRELLYNLPPLDRLDLRMYEDDDRAELERIDIADEDAAKLAKSTITPPSSATSGLSNYDLEGARQRRKKRRSKVKSPSQEPPAMDALKLFIPITKVDAAQRLVYGLATAETEDRSGEVCDYATTKPYYEKWSGDFAKATDGKSLGNLRSMHGSTAAGKLTAIAFNDDAKQIEICAKVVDDSEWGKVEEGVYTGFSQGGKYIKRWKDDAGKQRYTAEPIEVSLVDAPCLKDATFSMIKADGSTELRKFKVVEAPKVVTNGDVAKKAIELATAVGKEKDWGSFVKQASDELEAAAAAAAPPVAKAETPNDNEVGEQVWINDRLPGKTFKKKAELRQALLDLDADVAAKTQAKPVLDALADIKNKLGKTGGDAAKPGETVVVVKTDPPAGDGTVAKKDYSDDERKDMASKGEAKKDGSYPIKTATDVANAVKDWNRSKGSASDKRHIVKRAKAIGKEATDNLPADWSGSTKDKDASKVAGDGALAKAVSLWSVSDLILLLAAIDSAEENAELPSWGFGASVELPKDLCDRFGAALVEMGDIAAEMLDVVLGAMKEEEAGEAMANAALIADLKKLAGDRVLMKAGAKHSKADKEKIKKAHDLLSDLDPDCCPDNDDDDENAEKIVKVLEARLTAKDTAYAKQIAEISEIVKAIAAQPLPMGTSSVLRVIDKTQDGRPDFGKLADQLEGGGASDDGLERFVNALAARRQIAAPTK